MTFPVHFQWGTATSAYQIEGATTADGRGPTDWDEFASRAGAINRGDTADVAAEHYNRFGEDFDLLAELGVDTYRFSISWTRVMPTGTRPVNKRGLAHYSRLVDELLRRNIRPMVTLNHMELPLPLAQSGGWLNRSTIDAFVEYAAVVHDALGDRVDLWSTLNEVSLMAWFGFGTTYFPPGLDDQRLVLPAIHHQMVAHGRAVQRMREAQPHGSYGIVGSYWPIRTPDDNAVNREAVEHLDLFLNRSALDILTSRPYPAELLAWHERIGGAPFIADDDLEHAAGTVDYFGLNYYSPVYVVADVTAPGGPSVPAGLGVRQVTPDLPTTALGWPIVPDGLCEVLQTLHDRYELPIMITENGAAFEDYVPPTGRIEDTDRIQFLEQHISAVEDAIDAGVDVRGYMAWSLIDNFEWAEGFAKRFGLVFIDYLTQRRIPKRSFHWYADRIAQHRRSASDQPPRSRRKGV